MKHFVGNYTLVQEHMAMFNIQHIQENPVLLYFLPRIVTLGSVADAAWDAKGVTTPLAGGQGRQSPPCMVPEILKINT